MNERKEKSPQGLGLNTSPSEIGRYFPLWGVGGKATLALAKASFRSITRSPSAVIFTLAFPLIFIVVFGLIGEGGTKIDVALTPDSDLQNPVIAALKEKEMVRLTTDDTEENIAIGLEKGSYDAVLRIEKNPQGYPLYFTHVQYTSASPDKGNILSAVLNDIGYRLNHVDQTPAVTEIKATTVTGRLFRSIDFILPGQLGFSLLSTGVFGTAFIFFALRQNLVIKRFFATPVRRSSIVLGEAIARIGFALLGAIFIILIGHYAFQFTLVKGAVTVINMLLLSALGLIVFMGFGFVVSGLAKSESVIPPISNIITLPQFLLSGTFFSINTFPAWLQPISKVLPLTYLNDALRQVAFEGASLWAVKQQILIMLLWGIGIYAVAVKTFKWE